MVKGRAMQLLLAQRIASAASWRPAWWSVPTARVLSAAMAPGRTLGADCGVAFAAKGGPDTGLS